MRKLGIYNETLMLLALFLGFAFFSWPWTAPFSMDLSRETTIGGRLWAGEDLFVNIRYLYGPLSPYLLKWIVGIFGDSLLTYYCYSLLLTFGVLSLLNFISIHYLGRTFGFLVTLFYQLSFTFFGPILGVSIIPYSYAFLLAELLIMIQFVLLLGGLKSHTLLNNKDFYKYGVILGLLLVTKMEFFLTSFLVTIGFLAIRSQSEKSKFPNTMKLMVFIFSCLTPSAIWVVYLLKTGGNLDDILESYFHSRVAANLFQWLPMKYYFLQSVSNKFLVYTVWISFLFILSKIKGVWINFGIGTLVVAFLIQLSTGGAKGLPVPDTDFYYPMIITFVLFFTFHVVLKFFYTKTEIEPKWGLLYAILLSLLVRDVLQFGVLIRLVPNFASAIFTFPLFFVVYGLLIKKIYGNIIRNQPGISKWVSVTLIASLVLLIPIFSNIKGMSHHVNELIIKSVGGDTFRVPGNSRQVEVIDFVNSELDSRARLLSIQSEFIHRYSSFKNLTAYDHILNNLLTEDDERNVIKLINEKKINYILIGMYNSNYLHAGKDCLVHLYNYIRSNFTEIKRFGNVDLYYKPMDFNLYSPIEEGGYILLRRN